MTEWNDWGAPVRVRIEAAPVWAFARAVKDKNPVFASARAAAELGLASSPVPPTFTFAMTHSCAFPDLQESGKPTSLMDGDMDALMARGGLYLHGEQEFVYHRTPLVGDELEGRTRTSIPEMRPRGSKATMEVTYYETEWRDLNTGDPVVTETITSLWLPDPPA
jgi:hypothetical protein